jgi:hypothetical protein
VSGPVAVLAIVALLTLCGLGALAVLGVATSPAELVRRAGQAPLAGMAWAGIVAATLATAGSRLGLGGLAVLTVATCAGGAVRLVRGSAPAPSERRSVGLLDVAVSVAAVVVLAVVVAVAAATLRVLPLVEYDAWAVWGMKARTIAVLGAADPDVFASDAYARLHIEYPLLLPSLHALPLQAADGFSSNTVILSCLAVGLAGLLALWALFRDRVRPVLLLPAVAMIAAAPAFFGQLGNGYADVPLAVFVACGLGAAGRWLVDRDTSWLALATLFLSAAVLTKNEGLLFAAAVYVSLLVGARGRRRAVGVATLACGVLFAPWRATSLSTTWERPTTTCPRRSTCLSSSAASIVLRSPRRASSTRRSYPGSSGCSSRSGSPRPRWRSSSLRALSPCSPRGSGCSRSPG